MNLAKDIYDEYLESIDCEFRVEDMDEMDYKDELGVIDFMIRKFKEFLEKLNEPILNEVQMRAMIVTKLSSLTGSESRGKE